MKKHALIVGGGPVSKSFFYRLMDDLRDRHGDELLVCACDSGYDTLFSYRVTPDILIGDFDSLRAEYESAEAFSGETIRLPREKDLTDLQAACEEIVKRGLSGATLIGATGGRLDHTLGNLALLPMLEKQGVSAEIMDEQNRVRYTCGRMEIKKDEQYGRYVSLIPAGGEAKGITLTGFYYPLTNENLSTDNTRGVSNEIADATAVIEIASGGLYVLETRD